MAERQTLRVASFDDWMVFGRFQGAYFNLDRYDERISYPKFETGIPRWHGTTRTESWSPPFDYMTELEPESPGYGYERHAN